MDSADKFDGDNSNERILSLYHRPSMSFSAGIGTEIPDAENLAHFSVTTVLTYCKTKILKPYLRLLSITGLRPFSTDQSESVTFVGCCSYLYISMLLLLMIIGYILQYMSCFRRDRGFGYKLLETNIFQAHAYNKVYENICYDSIVFSYVIPHVMHFLGYIYAFLILRSSDDDQLPSLMETVFLSLSNLSNGFQSQKKLIKTLWVFVGITVLWTILSLITVNIMMGQKVIEFKWFTKADPAVIIIMKVFLITSTLWQDIIQATVISNYCLQTQLLISYMCFLKAKLIQNLAQSIEWMKDIEEFKKLLHFLNKKLAPSVCLFTVINISRGITGVLWLLDLDRIDKENACIVGISILNVILWILLSLVPFVQAARLSTACEMIRSVGHEIRVRPFSHQETPSYRLDSLLLYSSNLRINAKLFGVPIKMHYLYFFLTVCVIGLIVFGQLHHFVKNV